jgi:hypothetical protein
MDDLERRARAAAARTYADVLDPPDTNGEKTTGETVNLDPDERMFIVLSGFEDINDRCNRGVTREEAGLIAKRAHLNTRGLAGFYTSTYGALIVKQVDPALGDACRFITPLGRQRVAALRAVRAA